MKTAVPGYMSNLMSMLAQAQFNGETAQLLQNTDYDLGVLRPWLDDNGRTHVTINGGTPQETSPVINATSLLRKEDWLALDSAIMGAARSRLRLVADLNAAGLTYNIPNGMGVTVFQTERASDINEATLSMDGQRESEKDRPLFDLVNLPLPIAHKDFEFPLRQLAASRRGGSPLDVTTGERAGRRVAEIIEQLAIGTQTYPTFGGGTIYGVTNFPSSNTRDITAPTETGWTPATALADVLAMIAQLADDLHFGPYMLYVSKDWVPYLDNDFSTTKGDNSLRQRLVAVEDIQGIRTLDYLPSGFRMVLISMNTDTIRMVNFIPLTTVRWESKGGFLEHFKVLQGSVPQVRADINGNSGIVYGVPA